MGRLINLCIPIAIISSSILIRESSSYQVRTDPFRQAETLDPEGRYLLEWEVDWSSKRITFNVTVKTTNWVGFGLSNNGIATGVDLVVGGVDDHGDSYFSDRHMNTGSPIAVLDKHQDWTLHTAWESRTQTFLCFSRPLDTCDPEDFQITANQIRLFWAYGKDDNEDGAYPQRSGTTSIYLLDPDFAPQIVRDRRTGAPTLITSNRNENIPRDTKTWSVEISRTLPSNTTSYFCSIHKVPRVKSKHHLIGYDIHMPNELSRNRAHHMLMYKCRPPPGVSRRQMFEPHLSNPGEKCYRFREGGDGTLPTPFCSELYMGWAIGGKAFFLPDHVGIAIGEAENDYYMIQMHYDNPQEELNQLVSVRLDFFYTSHLRPNEGGMFLVHADLPGTPESLLIAPNSTDHKYFVHCSPDCSKRLYPPSGITISAVGLHAHNSAVGMRLRHFRGGKELPWVIYDDNYNNRFQPIRHVQNGVGVKVLPGDHLINECHYTNGGRTAVGGFATTQEMCSSFIIHYQKIQEYSSCSSGINSLKARYEYLGIRNVSWVESELEFVVDTPRSLSGLTVSQVSDIFGDWTTKKRRDLQRYHEVHPHEGSCIKNLSARSSLTVAPPGPTNTVDDFRGPISYPFKATPYKPPGRSCPTKIG